MPLTDIVPGGQSFADQVNQSKINPINMITSARSVADGVANFFLKPANAKGLAGFVFDYEGETVVDHKAEISDHYSEQNTFRNDHVAQRPARIMLRGFVGELSLDPNQGVLGAIATIQNKLTTLPAILGKYTPSQVQKFQKLATQATNVVNKVDNAISRAQNVLGLITGFPAPTKQQLAYQKLFCLYQANAVFTLDTPFKYFESMMIESMSFLQDELTKDWCEISVTVKEVRFVGITVSEGLSPQLAYQKLGGRAKFSGQGQTNQGVGQGTTQAFKFDLDAYGHKTQTIGSS